MRGRTRTNDVTDQQIVETYQQLGRGRLVAQQLGVSTPTVYAVLRQHNVPLLWVTGKQRVPDAEIIAAYQSIGSGIKVARQLHVSEVVVYKVLAQHGIATDVDHNRRRRIQGEDEQRVLNLHKSGLSAPKIAEQLGLPKYSVWSFLNRSQAYAARRLSDDDKRQVRELYASGLTAKEVGARIGRGERQLLSFLDSENLTRRLGKREKSPTWKGGRWFHKKANAWYVHVADDDPLASMRNKEGYVAENRLVMARKLGRPLTPNETVHHKNLDHSDNAEHNLQLRQGKHGKGAVLRCRHCGSYDIEPAEIEAAATADTFLTAHATAPGGTWTPTDTD